MATANRRAGEVSRQAGDWLRRTGRGLRDTAQGRRQLTVIVVVLGLLLIGGGWYLGFGRYTEAPTLLDLTKENAATEAARLGFSVDYSTGIFSETVPVDTVMRQSPSAGGRVVKGGTITLTLSRGPERYEIPDVAGQLLDFARTRMPKQLQVQVKDGYSDSLPVGYVVGTEPKAGTLLKPNETVTIIKVTGPYPVHLPTVVGLKLSDAEAQLRAAGFSQLDVQHKDDPTKPKDTVLEQNPGGGQGVESGAAAAAMKVTIIVSNGPALKMPQLVNQPCKSASDQLAAMQIVVTSNVPEPLRGTPGVVVKSQSVKEGDPLTAGQTVDLQCGL
jgi:serine/threonine-protein kinase